MKRIFLPALGLLATAFSASCLFASPSYQPSRTSRPWFEKGVVYQIQPRAFSPDGSLKGIEERLPYVRGLGVTTVYLCPVWKMDEGMDKAFWSERQVKSGFENPRNQYRIADFFHVDSEYGTDEDLKSLVRTAHKVGLRVLFDLVYFHCGPNAPILKSHPDFVFQNPDGTPKLGPWRFPQFDFRVPALREFLMTNLIYLMAEFDCDGFRCDVGARIPTEFWCEARRRMDAFKPDSVLLCEGMDYANQTYAFDANYGRFPAGRLFADGGKGGSAKALVADWKTRAGKSSLGARFVNHYENHDFATDFRPRREVQWTHDGVDQVLVWEFLLDGIPMLFNGNEFAEASDHSMFGRTPLDWAARDTPAGRARAELVARLIKLRAEVPTLTALNGQDGLAWLAVKHPAHVTAFVRRAPGCPTVFVIQNWRPFPVQTRVNFKSEKDGAPVVSGRISDVPMLAKNAKKTDELAFDLGPYGYFVGTVLQQ